MDANHLGNLPTLVLPHRAKPAATAPPAQQRDQLLIQFPTRIDIDGVVDRLVGRALSGIRRISDYLETPIKANELNIA